MDLFHCDTLFLSFNDDSIKVFGRLGNLKYIQIYEHLFLYSN